MDIKKGIGLKKYSTPDIFDFTWKKIRNKKVLIQKLFKNNKNIIIKVLKSQDISNKDIIKRNVFIKLKSLRKVGSLIIVP